MITAGLSGVATACEPGYMGARYPSTRRCDRTRSTVLAVEALGRFAELMARPPERVPLDEAALCVAAVAQPGLDVDVQLARLDELASSVATPTRSGLVSALFDSGRFAGNADDYYDPGNSYLDQVLDRGLGIPITLAVVAIEVGRRVDVPLEGVGMPGHFLVRDGHDPTTFVDVFHGGHLLDVDACRALFTRSMGRPAPWHDAYLAPVTAGAIVERMVSNLRLVFQRRHDRAALRWVMRLRVRCPGATDDDRAELHRLMAELN
jgi:regulator of sirC expression with transglutaminase-like and TPR domain